jgi:pyruvate dehydrogenase E1 component alpha subunit
MERKARSAKGGAREALLAATSMQLQPGDLLSPNAMSEALTEALAPLGKTAKLSGLLTTKAETRLTVCAGVARGMVASTANGLVLAYTSAGSVESGWQDALAFAHEEQLPLILACEDSTGNSNRKTKKDALSWTAMQAFAQKLKLPTLVVDGEDAVAVYRVMQESVIRARYGGGPAILWAITSPRTKQLTPSQQPLGRLKSYMKVRNIPLPKRP